MGQQSVSCLEIILFSLRKLRVDGSEHLGSTTMEVYLTVSTQPLDKKSIPILPVGAR
jgi:hypothetical protein